MADKNSITLLDDTSTLPAILANPSEVARIESAIDVRDRAAISVYGDRAQQALNMRLTPMPWCCTSVVSQFEICPP
jgi:hypothetical protein